MLKCSTAKATMHCVQFIKKACENCLNLEGFAHSTLLV